MKDRLQPCIYYVCKGETCKKGFVNVDMSKCKNCAKYKGISCEYDPDISCVILKA